MGQRPAPTRWDTRGLASVGISVGWLLVFVHEAYEIFFDLVLCVDECDPFAHFKVHPFIHIVIELVIAGLAGALLFASAAEIRNRVVRAQ
jgi:hypothetical protein